MEVALNSPDKLYTKNEGLKSMSKSQLNDFTSTSPKGLPEYKGKKKKKGGLHNLPSNSSPSSDSAMNDSSSLYK